MGVLYLSTFLEALCPGSLPLGCSVSQLTWLAEMLSKMCEHFQVRYPAAARSPHKQHQGKIQQDAQDLCVLPLVPAQQIEQPTDNMSAKSLWHAEESEGLMKGHKYTMKAVAQPQENGTPGSVLLLPWNCLSVKLEPAQEGKTSTLSTETLE